MQHGYLKPSPPMLTRVGYPSTFLLPEDDMEIDITPIDLNGKIHPGTYGSEFGAYKIIGREISVKRFLHDNGQVKLFVKGNQSIVVSKWSYNKNAPSQELQNIQTGITIGKTLASAAKGTAQDSAFVGAGTAVKAGLNAGKLVYDHFNTKEIDLDKVPNPDGSKWKKFKNAIKQVKDNVTGDRVAVLISVLAPPPKVAGTYNTNMTSVTLSNVASIIKGL